MRYRLLLIASLLFAVVAAGTAAAGTTPQMSVKLVNDAASGHSFAVSAIGEPTAPCWVLGGLAGTPDPVPSPGSQTIPTGIPATCPYLAVQDMRLFWVFSEAGQPAYRAITWPGNPQGTISLGAARGAFLTWQGLPSPGVPLQVASNELLCLQATLASPQQFVFQLGSANCGTTTLTVTVNGSGSVASSPRGIACGTGCSQQQFEVPVGSTWTLVGNQSSDSVLTSWGPDGACTGSDDDCTFTVNGPTEVTANFGPPPGYTVTVGEAGTGQGTLTSNVPGIDCTDNAGTCSALFQTPGMVAITATPAPGSRLAGFAGPCLVASDDPNTCWVMPPADATVTVTFDGTPGPPAPTPAPTPAPAPAPGPGPVPMVTPYLGPNPPGPIPTANPGIRPALTGMGLLRSTVQAGVPTEIAYRLNMNAQVVLRFTNLANPAHRYAYAFTPGKAGGDAGFNHVVIRTRVAGHPVRPGRWRIQVSGVNAAGRISTQTRVLTIR